MPYSGLRYSTHWQGFFRDNTEAESSCWPCQRLQKSSRKKGGAEKSQETSDPALFLHKTGSVTLDKYWNPLGFDFLACQVGKQHLFANLSGFWRSNKSQEMCFEKHRPCSDAKDDWDVAAGKSFYLCVLRSTISKGKPISLPTSQPLHWRAKPRRGRSWGLPALLCQSLLLVLPPFNATCSESLCNWANTNINLLLQHATYYSESYFYESFLPPL